MHKVALHIIAITALLSLLAGCSAVRTQEPLQPGSRYSIEGVASFYGARHAGRRTASGERFDPRALTAAHRTLPFGSQVRVTNLSNRKSVTVRINDRGPHTRGRIIDLSEQAAASIGMRNQGTARVRLEPAANIDTASSDQDVTKR
ncbi:rare lipoprotein A [Pseudomonas duriflava]|uniref:Endolytic peptidoglycan transglycosylase RlpA n=1 Tax=Pseudomonas duriflava TaxID=459528 RepID=A0A562QF46_9PSED|nr:septal ring lytic transglycosylase RlpA family protein [Pseudomonas duriflava]TWI55372.1 rare lipoprotein A [Pseudomonas duriflava]